MGEGGREGGREKPSNLCLPCPPPLLQLQFRSHVQAQPGIFQIYKLDFPSAQQRLRFPSSSTCQLPSPLTPAPSKMKHSQEHSSFFQSLISSQKSTALCTAETFPPCHQLQLEHFQYICMYKSSSRQLLL